MIPHQELRVMGHNMTKLQELRNEAQVIMTLLQGPHNKDPSMILRQELLVMQVNMTPLIESEDKRT